MFYNACVYHTPPKCFSLLSYPFGAAIIYSTKTTSLNFIEYTCLALAITEVLLYTVEPRLRSYAIFAKCCFVHSKGVDAYILLKLYISSTSTHTPIVVMNKSCSIFALTHLFLCSHHSLTSSTQQKFCEVEIATFRSFFHDSTYRRKVALYLSAIVYSIRVLRSR